MAEPLFQVFLKDDEFIEPDDSVYYLLAANGLFQVKKTRFFTSSSLVMESVKGKGLPWLLKHEASIRITLSKKVPPEIIKKALGFFRAVFDKYKNAEAIVILYWSPEEGEYSVIAPNQKVMAAGLPHYDVGENPKGLIRIGTIHSHGSIEAFHSAVDQADEARDDGIHITIGNIDSIPSYSCAIASDGQRLTIPIKNIVESGPEEEFPEEWLDNVQLAPKIKAIPVIIPASGYPIIPPGSTYPLAKSQQSGTNNRRTKK